MTPVLEPPAEGRCEHRLDLPRLEAQRRRLGGALPEVAGSPHLAQSIMAPMVSRVLIASPRGYCAGVERAVETVECALENYGPPIYVRKQIVHNAHVVRDFAARGVIFVESEEDVPEGERLVLAAHGVAPEVYDNAAARDLATIDATCPLVSKVHAEARRYADAGYEIVLVGHAGHDEVVGTMAEAPEAIVLVETIEQARAVELPRADRVAYVTQTTLSVDETAEIISVLRDRFPAIIGPRKDDICYATTNRQRAVKDMLHEIDVLLVIGSRDSSNSNRLVETAQAANVPGYLIDDESEIDEHWLDGFETVGITSGASVPEKLVVRVCDWFRARGVAEIVPFVSPPEDVFFKPPLELRHAQARSRA